MTVQALFDFSIVEDNLTPRVKDFLHHGKL